jgi:predicted enzyme related to lactoylglutathione lyase
MSAEKNKRIGTIGWLDISVPDAPKLRDFYSKVVGWAAEDVSMGEYNDYSMAAPGNGVATAGVCHARGVNADLPPQWLIYIIVADVDKSATSCVANGGTLMIDPRGLAGGRFCVIKDPVGAVLALYQEAE